MKKKAFLAGVFAILMHCGNLSAHCQLPCGIYHDDMVFEEIDQYVETMYKGISVMNDNKFGTPTEKNQFTRWVINKEESTNGIATRMCEYFLQQKIKPGEDDTEKKIISIHKMLFLLVAIKQNVDIEIVKQFNKEWENFKLMFHSHDYECEMESTRLIEYKEKDKAIQQPAKAPEKTQDIKTMVPNPPKDKK